MNKPENLWIEVGVLCKTMKEKRSIIEALKQQFDVDVKSVGNSKRRWLEATVLMEDMTEEEAVNKVNKLLEGTGAEGWLDVWTHTFSRHVTAKSANELPTVKRGKKKYYFDVRLSQLRNVNNPHDFVDLSSEETEKLQARIAKEQNIERKAAKFISDRLARGEK